MGGGGLESSEATLGSLVACTDTDPILIAMAKRSAEVQVCFFQASRPAFTRPTIQERPASCRDIPVEGGEGIGHVSNPSAGLPFQPIQWGLSEINLAAPGRLGKFNILPCRSPVVCKGPETSIHGPQTTACAVDGRKQDCGEQHKQPGHPVLHGVGRTSQRDRAVTARGGAVVGSCIFRFAQCLLIIRPRARWSDSSVAYIYQLCSSKIPNIPNIQPHPPVPRASSVSKLQSRPLEHIDIPRIPCNHLTAKLSSINKLLILHT